MGALVLSACAPSSVTAGAVDIELRPASQFVSVGATASLDLHAVSADGFDQEFGLIGVVIQWDAAAMVLSGNVDNGAFAWAASGFPADSAGLNNDLTDGDAYYQATVLETGELATATSGGLLVTTLEFTALPGATGVTAVTIQPCNGSTCTIVLDRHPFDPAATQITGLLGAPVAVTIECNADPDCDDGNPCTDDTCAPDSTCINTPNDNNDPNDGLFCNGNEIACDNGEIIIEAGSIPDCDDDLTCTDDACNESTMQCDNTITAGSCLIDGVCETDGTANPANECQVCESMTDPGGWSDRSDGTLCGNPNHSDCDGRDTCDGFGVCQDNIAAFGDPCGSSVDNDCTEPDTCDGSGACLRNDATDGSACNDGRFCTITDTCSGGACVGVGDPCVDTVCNDALDECKAIDLEWRDVLPQPAVNGQIVEIDLYAVSGTDVDQVMSGAAVVFRWDPTRLQLLGNVDNGPYSWLISWFPDDSALDGLNDTWTDGDALYQALGLPQPNPSPIASLDGLLITTLRFEVLTAVDAQVEFVLVVGAGTRTQVLDLNPPGLNITGVLGAPAIVEVVECLVDQDCDDEQFCNGIESCESNVCVPGTPPDCSDTVFCNGVEFCDPELECVSPGNPCPLPESCDEPDASCGGCLTPTVVAAGSRYLTITPATDDDAVALLVEGDPDDPRVACISLHVQSDGSLGAQPVFQTPTAWATVQLTGLLITPNARYTVYADCSNLSPGLLSAPAQVRTGVWGDVNGNGDVGITDVAITANAALGTYEPGITPQDVDIAPCEPDGIIDEQDIAMVGAAFGNDPYPCELPCLAAGPNDACTLATTVGEETVEFDTTEATTDGPPESSTCAFTGDGPIASDLWYCYQPSCTGMATVSLCDSAFDTRVAVYNGCDCPNEASAIACDDDSCGSQSVVSFPVSECETRLIRVGGSVGENGLGTMTITCQPGPPASDCNENGIADACDIADQTSTDLNENGVPDECDPVIPTVSAWGIVVLALWLTIVATILIDRRRLGCMGNP